MQERVYTINETAQRLNLKLSDTGIVRSLISRGKLDLKNRGHTIRVTEKSITRLFEETRRDETYDEIISKLLDLQELYCKNRMQIPVFLKGTIGECLTMKQLNCQRHLKRSVILYLGGTTPKADIVVNGKKIQVKTQFPHGYEIVKNVECFSSPTIRKSAFSSVDYIVLVIVGQKDVRLADYYIFAKEDFSYFNEIGCWSGKSKGDRTIYCIQEITGPLSKSGQKIVGQYHNGNYKGLFENSKNNWEKITV